MQRLILIAKAFSEPSRIRILAALRAGELCVCELCDVLGITQSTLSTHLQQIRKAGLVSARREGKWMYYTLNAGAVPILKALFKASAMSESSDRLLRADAKKLSQRFQMRVGGACCVGFSTQPTPKPRRP